jgi:tRNA dimethylallyltransferase
VIVVLCGPTSAGKTEIAIDVASQWDAAIVSADAMQVYRGMDIGTGKATPGEREQVPHLGLDVVRPDEPFDASAFVTLCREAIETHERVIVAGGTSLYIQALIRGLVKTPPVDAALRASLEAQTDLHAQLARVDPVLAARLHPNDRIRLIRGLEVFQSGGVRLSELQEIHRSQPDQVEAEGLWLDRPELDARIDRRVMGMIERGYVAEVQSLLASGYGRALKPMQSLGYRHLCDHVLDDLSLDEAIRRTQRDTRRFARKQRTWMKSLGYPRVIENRRDKALAAADRAFRHVKSSS